MATRSQKYPAINFNSGESLLLARCSVVTLFSHQEGREGKKKLPKFDRKEQNDSEGALAGVEWRRAGGLLGTETGWGLWRAYDTSQ